MRSFTLAFLATLICLTALPWDVVAEEKEPLKRQVDFALDVEPILKRNCFRCHGTKNQEGGLRLNRRDDAMDEADSGEPIVASGHADKSLLIQRLIDEDAGDIMPLDGQPLSESEIDTLRRWIDSGADWPDGLAEGEHWAYQPIERPNVPAKSKMSTSPIDAFIARRLDKRGLQFSPKLDRARLLRRVSLALIGLPPAPEDVAAFVKDDSPDAYEKAVDRLLASKHYGERWAVPWMDLARYADSNGFQADQLRDNWAWRDWLIRSLNDDMPFDQFVTWQIAGDLLPEATVEQKIATGFHRMTTCNVEAGVDPEANRMNQVIDRVNTTATVFLGSTLECAQCHDHKYDPFSQKDYYQILAYFNNTPLEVKQTSGVTWDFFGPTMDLPMNDTKQENYQQLKTELAGLESERKQLVADSNKDFDEWVLSIRESNSQTTGWQTAVPVSFESTGKSTVKEEFKILDDGSVLLSGQVPDKADYHFTFAATTEPIVAIKLDLLTDDTIPGKGPGRGDPKRTNVVVNELTCELKTPKESSPLKLTHASADFSQAGWPVAGAIDGDKKSGWAFAPQFGKPHWATFTFESPLKFPSTNDQLVVNLAQYLGSGRVAGKPRISFYIGDPLLLNLNESDLKIARKEKLNAADQKKLRKVFDKINPRVQKIDSKIADAKKSIKSVTPDTTLVMVEMNKPRETFVLDRGVYDNPLDKVQPRAPELLPAFDEVEKTGDRLELAGWLTSPENPLLARVTVNRWWAQFFGTGIVDTPEDFGTQASSPTHPQLLDWLASEFIETGWSMKHVHKQIVMSHAFQQDARCSAELLEADPKNRLLARGPRFRLPAEFVRDNALAISGLLSEKMYGEPIMPFQPDKLWRSVGRNQPKWVAADNEDRFRRGAYVIWKRAAPYPSFITFDAPDRGSCTVNRPRSNTPLQALTMLNDPAYAEMALAFADRVLTESPSNSDESRLNFAMQVAVSREASEQEIEILKQLLHEERQRLKDDDKTVSLRTQPRTKAMVLKSNDARELAAWFAVTNAILNLDEVLNR